MAEASLKTPTGTETGLSGGTERDIRAVLETIRADDVPADVA